MLTTHHLLNDMALNEIDQNVIQPDSRASTFSGSHKEYTGPRPSSNSGKARGTASADVFSTGSGVLSMLKTTTEMGDIGNIPLMSSRLPKSSSRPSMPRKNGSSNGLPPSRTSSHYSHNGSVRSASSMRSAQTHGSSRRMAVPYNDFRYARSQEFYQPRSDTRSVGTPESIHSSVVGVPERFYQTERSYSLTQTLPHTSGLSDQRSLSSLRSQGLMPRPHSPYMYPARPSGGPVYRPSSPSLSDTAGTMYHHRSRARPGPGPRAHTTSSPLYSRFGEETTQRHLIKRPPPSVRSNRTIEDLKRPFINGGGISNAPPPEVPPPYRGVRPPPGLVSQANLGPPLPHFRSSPSPMYGNRIPIIPDEPPKFPVEEATPYRGFVQRVKNVLEERISSDEVRRLSRPDLVKSSSASYHSPKKPRNHASSSTPSFDMAELPGTFPSEPEPASIKRLTRELIKAGVGAGSDFGAASELASDASPGTLPETDTNSSRQSHDALSDESDVSIDNARAVPISQIPKSGEALRSSILAVVSRQNSSVKKDTQSPAGALSSSTAGEAVRSSRGQSQLTSYTAILPISTAVSPLPNNDSVDVAVSDPSAPRPLSRSQARPHTMIVASKNEDPGPKRSTSARSLPLKEGTKDPSSATLTSGTESIQIASEASKRTSASRPKSKGAFHPSNAGSIFHRIAASRASSEVTSRPQSVVSNDQRQSTMQKDVRSSEEVKSSPMLESASRRQSTTSESAERQPEQRTSTRSSSAPERCSEDDSSTQVTGTNAEVRVNPTRGFYAPLPDLTEDSQEDASTTNLRILGARPPVFRAAGRRTAHSDLLSSPRVSMVPKSPRTYLGRPVVESRHLPSFTFSKTDLTAKLNFALGLRNSRSFEEVRARPKSMVAPTPERPVSSTMLRERYASFFTIDDESTEDIGSFDGQAEKTAKQEEFMSEINRLSIPSVNNLTVRLSELLPSIKRTRSDFNLARLDEAVQGTVQEIRGIGSDKRASTASHSDGFGSNDGTAVAPTRRGTVNTSSVTAEEKAIRRYGMLRLMKDLPPLPADVSEHRASQASTTSRPRRASTAQASMQEPATATGSARASPAKAKVKVVHEIGTTSPRKFILKKPNRSLHLSPVSKHPWNKEGSQHGQDGPSTMTMTFASSTRPATASPTPRARVRPTRSASDPTLPSDESVRIARSMSPGLRFEASLVPKTDLFTAEAKPIQRGGHNIVGSIKRRIGLGTRVDKAGFPIDPAFLHPEERAHDPGDRYPVTGLTPPAGMTIDENRSYFSDDSSNHSARFVGMRKRFTRFRPAKRPASRQVSANDSRSSIRRAHHDDGGSVFEDSGLGPEQHSPYDDEHPIAGMSKSEFRRKRLIEKMRALWYKSGELIKNFNRPKKQHRGMYDRRELPYGV
ncbi:MAG: hypothetical protein M1828_004804 [Chrysothrix sp. TS-e1954]|nr:MAG: hypothetical protein M1828_004804 [Chrysothrix sp. TS-e1954]